MYHDILDGDQFHNDDVHQGDPVFPTTKSPHYVTVDYEAAAARNLEYVRENIAREAEYQKRLLTPVVYVCAPASRS